MEEDQVAGSGSIEDEGGSLGPRAAEVNLHRSVHGRRVGHALRDQAGDLARLTTTHVGILVHHDALEVPGEHPPLVDDVGVTSIAGGGIDGRATDMRQPGHRLADLLERGRVVAIVADDSDAVEREEIEAPR